METNITGKLKDAITSKFTGLPPDERRNTIQQIEKAEQMEETSEKKHYTEFLKDKKDIVDVYKIIKSPKHSVREKRNKIKEFLKDPEELNNFFNKILNTHTKKKEENTEATGAGSAGGYSMPLFSGEEGDITGVNKKVPTVRESTEKVETKEATASGSSGQYSQPAIWAKSMSKKHWKGASTKYMPGAKRVQVKKKCKKFPYCNQGDINALKIFESESVQNAIDSVSGNYGYNKDYISEIVFREKRKRQN